MRLALKVKSQCARTIEVWAAMKNPLVVFAKQANISLGHRQVKNGMQQAMPTHVEKTINLHTELFEMNNGSKKMRIRATTTPNDKSMPTMAAQHRG